MFLAIDIGNTHTVFGLCENGHILETRRVNTGQALKSGYKTLLKNAFDLKEVTGAVVSSVVPRANPLIEAFCQTHLKAAPLMAEKHILPLEIDMDNPEEVGADRLINAVAVNAYYRAPAVVLDFGTATTFDVIDKKGRYAGGLIAPGINLSLKALHEATAKLPAIEITKPAQLIGKDTKSAMQSGIYWGYVGLIEGVLTRLIKDMNGGKPLILATGGLAPLFEDAVPLIQQIDKHLTLKGLIYIYERHKDGI